MKNPIRLNARIDVVTDEKLRTLSTQTELGMSEILRRLVEVATPEMLLTEKEKEILAKNSKK
jgi:hypothetical protein